MFLFLAKITWKQIFGRTITILVTAYSKFGILGWFLSELMPLVAIVSSCFSDFVDCLAFPKKSMLNMNIEMSDGKVWMHMSAYVCVTEA